MFEMKCFGWNSGHGWVWVKLISIQNFKLWLLDHPQSWKRRKNLGIRNRKTSPNSVFLYNYSLVRLVWQNTEELISRPFAGLYKIRLLLRDRKRTKNFRFYLALLQLQLCLQLQQNTMVPVDVDGQISHFCSQGFVPWWQILVNKSEKSDHPQQREPWCFVEVVNKVSVRDKTSSPQHSRYSWVIRFWSTHQNWFSSRNSRENSSSLYGTTRLGQL